MNPDTIGCVWTGEFDLNTLHVDGDFFESGKKNLRIQKYPDTCGQGLTTWRKILPARTIFQGKCVPYFL